MAKTSGRKKISRTLSENLPPFLYPTETKALNAWMTRLKKEKKIWKVGPRLYSSISKEKIETAVRTHWPEIVSQLFPDSLLSFRTALEFKPTSAGEIFLTSTTNRDIAYPGLVLKFIRGPRALSDDFTFRDLKCSSIARALLENFSTTKLTSARALPFEELERRLNGLRRTKGEAELDRIRERAFEISEDFGWEREFKKLDQAISEIRALDGLTSRLTRSKPVDLERLQRFDLLFAELKVNPLQELTDAFAARDHFRTKAFFESYFSNVIEGSTLEIEESEEIIFDRKKIDSKEADDLRGTFAIVSDQNEMRRVPESFVELEELLKSRHEVLMAARPEALPGIFKDQPNRAGDTHFVTPELVAGTLEKGFERYLALPNGLARAIFMMFLITEVHPFKDGNGRLARIMMNAELNSEELSTIIIPTVYHEEYLTALRTLSRRDRPDPLIRMLSRAHLFSTFEFSPYRKSLQYIEDHNWFREPDEAKLIE